MKKETLATLGARIRSSKPDDKFNVNSSTDRVLACQAASANGRTVKTSKLPGGKFQVWVID